METVRSSWEGQRILLRNTSSETYERLNAEDEERRVLHFYYDRAYWRSSARLPSTVSDVITSVIQELTVALVIDEFDASPCVRAEILKNAEPSL